MSTWALPCAPLTWSLFCAEGPTAPSSNLGFFRRVSPLSCEVLLSRGLTFWLPTHAPQSLVTRPGGVSTFFSYDARGLHWSWPSHGSYLSQGLPAVAWILHESGLPPNGTRTYGLEATFLFSLLLFWTFKARCLSWAMSYFGDVTGGCPVDFCSLGPLRVSPCVDFDSWSMPGNRTVHLSTDCSKGPTY